MLSNVNKGRDSAQSASKERWDVARSLRDRDDLGRTALLNSVCCEVVAAAPDTRHAANRLEPIEQFGHPQFGGGCAMRIGSHTSERHKVSADRQTRSNLAW
jgi:hypothetical protein